MIIGLTDRPIIRRDGKIRCGTGPKSGGFNNPDHFQMRDCPQLIPILGDNPKEIYFTFHSDNPSEVAKIDLRLYRATELVCQSMHNTADKMKPIGQWAAYRGTQDVAGLTQEPYPGMKRTRKRACAYKECPQYIQESCGEHLFLNVMIPQYSMSSIFTLDSTSIEAVLNTLGMFEKVGTQFGGKFSGEIFKLYKKKIQSTFFDTRKGATAKSEPHTVAIEHVAYEKYLELFGGSIPKENLEALDRLRSRQGIRIHSIYAGAALVAANAPALAIAGPDFDDMEGDTQNSQQLQVQGPTKADEDALKERANHVALLPLFDELSKLVGVENTELNRIKTARAIKSVDELVIYLKKKITEVKAKVKANQEKVAPPEEPVAAAVATPASQPAPPAAGPDDIDNPLF